MFLTLKLSRVKQERAKYYNTWKWAGHFGWSPCPPPYQRKPKWSRTRCKVHHRSCEELSVSENMHLQILDLLTLYWTQQWNHSESQWVKYVYSHNLKNCIIVIFCELFLCWGPSIMRSMISRWKCLIWGVRYCWKILPLVRSVISARWEIWVAAHPNWVIF